MPAEVKLNYCIMRDRHPEEKQDKHDKVDAESANVRNLAKLSQLFLLHLRLPLINQTGEIVVFFLQELQRGYNLLFPLLVDILAAPRPGSRPSILVRLLLINSSKAIEVVPVLLFLVILHSLPLYLERTCLRDAIKVVLGFGDPQILLN